MPARPTLFRPLVQERQWDNWSVFASHLERAARDLAAKTDEPRLFGVFVARRSFDRWMIGDLDSLPHRDHQVVLEHLLGYPCAELFGLPFDVSGPDCEKSYHDRLCPDRSGDECGSTARLLDPGEQAGTA